MHSEISNKISLAKNGDEKALSYLMAAFTPNIKASAAKCVSPGLEYEDIAQECMIALFRAIISYDSEKGATFSTYACACIENAAVSALRSANRKKHMALNTAVPLTDTDESVNEQSAEDVVFKSESYSTAIKHINNKLSQLEKNVLFAFLDGASYSVIASRLNITEKSVDNALQRIRAKLR